MKRLISFILFFTIIVSCVPLSVSAQRDLSYEEIQAQELKDLGLFRGVSDTDFALGRAPSRAEAIVMLIRMLGKESEATGSKWSHPFTDVPAWADNYVGYAYTTGLTKGISATEFGMGDASALMYLTFVLRALGYSDANNLDFAWDNPFPLAKSIGILYDKVNIETFWRADVVLISHAALRACLKGTTQTLAQKLVAANVFTQTTFDNTYNKTETPGTAVELTAEEIYAKCSPAVFYIEIYDSNNKAVASGSGFFIDDKGTAVTNYHVIEDAHSALIQTSDTKEVFEVKGVYDYSKEQDWAVIKVDCTGNKYLDISDAAVNGGAKVYAIGSPLGLQNTISDGIVSNPARETDGVNYIQITAAISSGSSGGALLNTSGEVIGITSAGYTDGQNLNLAIPVSYFKNFKKDTVISLSALFYTPTSTSNRKQKAIELLKNFVLDNYQSIDDSLEYEYTEKEIDSKGYILRTLFYDPVDNQYTVRIYHDRDTYTVTYFIDIDPQSDYVIATYVWRNYETGNTDIGTGTFLCKNIHPNYQYLFSEYDGNTYSLETDCKLALSMHIEGLQFIDYLFCEYINNIESYSTYDIGYTSYQTGNITYWPSKDEVHLTVGETSSISLNYEYSEFPSSFNVYIGTDNKTIATANWDNSVNSLPWKIDIHGKSQGTTYLVISNEHNNQYKKVKVVVHARGTYDSTTPTVTGYTGVPAVPDFGAYFNVARSSAYEIGDSQVYAKSYYYSQSDLYNNGVLDSFFLDYWQLLELCGFVYTESSTNDSGVIYTFKNHDKGLTINYSANDGRVAVIVFSF